MFGPKFVVRSLLAAPFIVGGTSVLRKGSAVVPIADGLVQPLAEAVGIHRDTLQLVRANGYVQIGAGALLTTGIAPRAAAIALAGSTILTTAAGHRFWETDQPEERSVQTQQFCKNAGLVGGLISFALHQGSRPSVFWSGRKTLNRTASSVGETAQSLSSTIRKAFRGVAAQVG